ncbi:uncharacterized protein G2W53_030832 [Senna tora]|uniref:Retrotransposon gag domain-containing protein n=1 Tax=Senna tora TaxID=362788 RepID=A0A834T6Q2_9FABA|nr:uncharacterized protein G2W53_030832 [Senna tora]
MLVSEMISNSAKELYVSELFPSWKWLHIITGVSGRTREMCRKIDLVLQNIIVGEESKDVKEEEGGGECLLKTLLNMKDQGDLTINQVKTVMLDMITAGTDAPPTIGVDRPDKACRMMEPDEATNSAVKKTPKQPPQSMVVGESGASKEGNVSKTAALLAAIAARKAGKHQENINPQQKEVQKTTPEQASATAPIYDDLVYELLKKQDELKKELRASNCKVTDLEKVIAQGQEKKIPEKARSEKSTSTPRGTKPRSKTGSRKQVSRRTRRKEESTTSDSDSHSEDYTSSDFQDSGYRRTKAKRERYPFTKEIMETKMPKLRTPAALGHYDGKSDPVAHVNSFKAAMMYAGASDEARFRAFPSTLKGDAQLWFSDLASGSINSFKQLAKKFTKYFATSRTIKRTSHCLKNIIQGENEPLKDFLDRFTKIARQIQGLKHEVALNYLTDNLRDCPFCQSITKKPPSSMEELMDRSAKYIAIEEVEASKAANAGKRDRADHKRKFSPDERPREDRRRSNHPKDRRDRYRRLIPKFKSYTSLNKTPARIIEDVHVASQLKFPVEKPIPIEADRSKYCKFHKTFGHETDNCHTLKDQIEELVRRGHLRQYLDHNKYGRTGDRDNSRKDRQDRDQRRDEPHQENHQRNVAGTINVIAGGITKGTETTPQSRRKQARSIMNLQYQSKRPRVSHPNEQPSGPSNVMTADIVDMREEASPKRPSPEGDLEEIALRDSSPSKTIRIGKLQGQIDGKCMLMVPPAGKGAECGSNPILKASLDRPSINLPIAKGLEVKEVDDWRTPILKYLGTGELPNEDAARRKVLKPWKYSSPTDRGPSSASGLLASAPETRSGALSGGGWSAASEDPSWGGKDSPAGKAPIAGESFAASSKSSARLKGTPAGGAGLIFPISVALISPSSFSPSLGEVAETSFPSTTDKYTFIPSKTMGKPGFSSFSDCQPQAANQMPWTDSDPGSLPLASRSDTLLLPVPFEVVDRLEDARAPEPSPRCGERTFLDRLAGEAGRMDERSFGGGSPSL